MTIVVAKAFGQRACVLSDTQVYDPDGTRADAFPGRLKTIVLSESITASYAGLAIQGLDAIRSALPIAVEGVDAVVAHLEACTREYSGELDFIVVAHAPDLQLTKVTSTGTARGGNAYAIGDHGMISAFSRYRDPALPVLGPEAPLSEQELGMRSTFNRFMVSTESANVAGAAIDCLASPEGHCYNTHTGAFSWNEIIVGGENEYENERDRDGGTYHYDYNVVGPNRRGVALVGLYLPQIRTGWIYDPIFSDAPMRLGSIGLPQFTYTVEDATETVRTAVMYSKRLQSTNRVGD